MRNFASRLALALCLPLLATHAAGCADESYVADTDFDLNLELAANEGGAQDSGGDEGAGDEGGADEGGADEGGADEGGADEGGAAQRPNGQLPGFESHCGNGILEGAEWCDDGAQNGDDQACTSHCFINFCGDGLVYADGEECDMGLNNGPDAWCTHECVWQGPQ